MLGSGSSQDRIDAAGSAAATLLDLAVAIIYFWLAVDGGWVTPKSLAVLVFGWLIQRFILIGIITCFFITTQSSFISSIQPFKAEYQLLGAA